ncbi:MAG: hypothetical protein EZS28_011893 [Streblomastix strix]|uniref:Uncharacterized protein n=2 Tax=Streblomastix strix TaxID=222440 RepID=A0A5J4WD08_9EUKA|nr:MAG: hypothetical protein EZS28_011893 [Streblomastix strix]
MGFWSGLKNFGSKILGGIKKAAGWVAPILNKVLGTLAGPVSTLHPGVGAVMEPMALENDETIRLELLFLTKKMSKGLDQYDNAIEDIIRDQRGSAEFQPALVSYLGSGPFGSSPCNI